MSQTLSGEIGQGFKFKDYHTPQFYQVQSTIKTAYTLTDDLKLDGIMMGAFSDGYTYLFGGSSINYTLYRKDKFSLSSGVSVLAGSEGRALYGLNLNAGYRDFYLSFNARQEYSRKEFWFDAAVGYIILK